MPVVADQVVVELEAEYQKYSQDVAAAQKRFDSAMSGMVASGKAAERQIKQSFENTADSAQIGAKAGATFGNNFAAGFLRSGITAIFSGALLNAIVANANAMGDLEDAARRANIPLKQMQEIIYTVQKEGLGEAQAVKDIEKLTKLIADAAENPRNGLRRLFEINGITIGGKDANAVLLDLARLMQDAPEGMKTKIADLSGLSEKWIAVLEKGPEAFMQSQKAASEAGVVLDDLAFRKAEEFRNAWNEATTKWGATMRKEISEILPLLDTLVTKGIEFASTIARVAGIVATELKNFPRLGDMNIYSNDQLKALKDFNAGPFGDKEALKRIEAVLAARNSVYDFGVGETPRVNINTGNNTTKLPPPYKGGNQLDSFEREEEQIRKRIALFEAEAGAIGQGNYERDRAKAFTELMTAAQKAYGDNVSFETVEKIHALADAYATAADNTRTLKERWDAANSVIKTFGDSAIDGIQGLISGTKTLNQVLADTLRTFSKMALQAALLGEGPLATLFGTKSATGGVGGLFGALFGGFRADGGPVQAGKSYVVGERGVEVFTPNVNGMITPNGASQKGGGNNYAVYADMRDSSATAIALLSNRIDRLETNLPDIISRSNADNRRLAPYG